MELTNEKIIIFGGTGSLGKALIERFGINSKGSSPKNNVVINFSRDEAKQLNLELMYNRNPFLKNVLGDIRDKEAVRTVLKREKPSIVIIAAALKQIDRCEYATDQCIKTNIIGIQNILNVVEEEIESFKLKIKSILFISTDKACYPINTYGMCKALSEKMVIEKAKELCNYHPIKFNVVRYGNVLNSTGSIIPILKSLSSNPECNSLKLTHEDMTRYIMTLDQSIDLIIYTILYANSGEIVIPFLRAMKIKELIELFAEQCKKKIELIGLRFGEKMHESLINQYESARAKRSEKYHNKYIHIIPDYSLNSLNTSNDDYNKINEVKEMRSDDEISLLTKKELHDYLKEIKLF